jgi:hypothetical protein
VSNRFCGGLRDLKLSNGATDVFLSVLQFALSDLAFDIWEQSLAQWVAWHDQNLLGAGSAGYDLAEIEWDPVDFPRQKAFLLKAIDQALTGYRWSELCYTPQHAELYLSQYRDVVRSFELPNDHRISKPFGWPGPEDIKTLCPRHRVHCSDYGWCRVCADCGTARTPELENGG